MRESLRPSRGRPGHRGIPWTGPPLVAVASRIAPMIPRTAESLVRETFDRRACYRCRRKTRHTRRTPNHVLHFFITWFTCGLWAVVWAGIALAWRWATPPWYCTVCGEAWRER